MRVSDIMILTPLPRPFRVYGLQTAAVPAIECAGRRLAGGPVFGLWRSCFPPVLVRTGRRLPVQALGERGVLVSVTGYPRGGAPGPG
jgi:hypothetical protein